MSDSGSTSARDPEFLLSQFVGNIPARIWIKDAQGRYAFVNQIIVTELQLERDQWIGSTDEQLFPSVGQVYWRKDLQVLSSGEPLISTDQIERGKFLFVLRFPMDLDGIPHVAAVGVETTQQITALLRIFHLRDELFRNERLRAIGEMASGLAHDLNNILNAASLRLNLIEAKASSELIPEVLALKRSILAATDRVRGIRDFVNTSQLEKIESVHLPMLIRDSIEMVDFVVQKTPTERGGTIRLESRIPDQMPSIAAPPNQLKHVFANLLINARDAMADGGNLVIEAKNAPASVEVVVSDEGAGIPEDILAKIFDPFFTTKSFGNGLGLSMARDVMTRIGGQIHAENRSPRGAKFVLSFPIAATTEGASAA